MRMQELVDNIERGDYVMTLNFFPASLDGLAVDMVIDPDVWRSMSERDIAERYFYAAIALIKERTSKEPKPIAVLVNR